jgi:hypothetical protein
MAGDVFYGVFFAATILLFNFTSFFLGGDFYCKVDAFLLLLRFIVGGLAAVVVDVNLLLLTYGVMSVYVLGPCFRLDYCKALFF